MQFYFQGAAVLVAVIIAIVRGITSGILLRGGSQEESVGHYLYESMKPIVIIAATPALLSMIAQISHLIVVDTTSAVMLEGTMADVLAAFQIGGSVPILSMVNSLIMLYVAYRIVKIAISLIWRQMQLTALSIIGPVVAITTVVDASELTTLVKEMIGVGLITAMQIIFLNAIFAFACYITDNPTYAISGIQISGLIAPFLLIGMLGAVERLPRWIERYTLVPTTLASGSGIARMGSIAIGVAARNIIGKVVR